MSASQHFSISNLPHGRGFRFVDSILSLDPGRSITASYTPSPDEPYFPGHFPGDPLVPGVIMIEALAQAAGLAAQSDTTIPPLANLRLAAVRQVKIHGTVPPDTPLTIEVSLTARLGPLVQASGTVRSPENLLLEGSITLSGTLA